MASRTAAATALALLAVVSATAAQPEEHAAILVPLTRNSAPVLHGGAFVSHKHTYSGKIRLGGVQAVSNFIAAFEPSATAAQGASAKEWGLWVGDPGADARTVLQIESGPPNWYSPLDWWKEEHSLIMPNPMPLPAGEYKVYGDTTQGGPKTLSVHADGGWALETGVTIDDVTHHPCKALRYMGARGSGCAAGKEAACTEHGSPVEYRVLIVQGQAGVVAKAGHLPPPSA